MLCSADIDRALLPTRNTAVATTIVLQPLDNLCQLPDPSVRTDGFHSSEVLLPSSILLLLPSHPGTCYRELEATTGATAHNLDEEHS